MSFETRCNKNSTLNARDSDTTPPGEGKDTVTVDNQFGDTLPCEEANEFDTQVMDFDDETQPVDLGEETQIMDLAGETQVMDDYEFIEDLDTQLLVVSDSETECGSDGEGAESTQVLHEVEVIEDSCGDQMDAIGEVEIRSCDNVNVEASIEPLPSEVAALRSGALRGELSASHSASIRAFVHSSGRRDSKTADDGSCSTEFSSGSSKLHSSNDYGGKSDVGRVDEEGDVDKHNENGLSNGSTSKVARSLAKKLFMEDDVVEEGYINSLSGGKADLSQGPACDYDLAGLSYVDSQEPGELSQANAIEFVDKFLKINILDSDQDVTHNNAVVETVSPGTAAKGPQSLAQQVNRRRALTGTSIFDWDDTHEDEGGGDFFTKKKEVLLGTSTGGRKSSTKPRGFKCHERRGSQSLGKVNIAKEQQNMHDLTMGFVHSDSKLLKSRKIDEHEEMNIRKKLDNNMDQQLGLGCSDRKVLPTEPNADLTEFFNVGIDTQMAAEAMEALSTASAFVSEDVGIADQNEKVGRRKCKIEGTKSNPSKKSSTNEGPSVSKSVISTRFRQTKGISAKSSKGSDCSVALRTRSQYVVEESNSDIVKPKETSRLLNMKTICAENEKESSDIAPANIGTKEGESINGELKKHGSLPVKRRSLRGKPRSSATTVEETRHHVTVNHLNSLNPDDASGDSRGQKGCFDIVQSGSVKRKRSTRNHLASEYAKSREETLNLNTGTNSAKVGGSRNRGRDHQHSTNQSSGSRKKESLLTASRSHEVVPLSFTTRTRSKRSARCVEGIQGGGGQDACQLSSKKRKAGSEPAKGAERAAFEGSPSPANVTPVNLKTPSDAVSPICVGDEYSTPSCKKRLSLKTEFYRLTSNEHKYSSPCKDLRQRRDISNIKVLFSQHLNEDVTRHQKKILSRLGFQMASAISDATHFVADEFVRTRNMLEAIANGKLVVTHLWLDSCAQAGCFIDEKNYILRDAKKERELGFSMPISLARATRHPLLEGRRVLFTPNVKPGKEIISSLIKAVHGQATERLCRTLSNNDRLPDDLLVLSCEEDFAECVPLLEKGIAVYSSELLLNGIITQKLEYERYRIFVDNVKKTRSTLWLKKDGIRFRPVNKTKQT